MITFLRKLFRRPQPNRRPSCNLKILRAFCFIAEIEGAERAVLLERIFFERDHLDQLWLVAPHMEERQMLGDLLDDDGGSLDIWFLNRTTKERKRGFCVQYAGFTWLPLQLDAWDEGRALEHVRLSGVTYSILD